MRYNFFFVLCWMLMSCSQTQPKKEPVSQVLPKDTIAIKSESLRVYELKTNAAIDSLLLSLEAFVKFKTTLEDLSKLNPTGIDPFLAEAIKTANDLLKEPMPAPFNAPDIKSRLKVVKTMLLKAHYYSQENKVEALNTSIKEIYEAYQAYLMRVEDFAQNDSESLSEGEISLDPRPSN